MKRNSTFITRLAMCALATSFAVVDAYAQGAGDATTGDDAHPAVDSPYLRKKSTPAPNAAAAAAKLSAKDQKFLSQIAAGGVQEVEDAKLAANQGNESTKKIASRILSERSASNKELVALAKKKGLGLGTDKIRGRNMGKANYDKQYIHTTSGDLREDVKLVQQAAQS